MLMKTKGFLLFFFNIGKYLTFFLKPYQISCHLQKGSPKLFLNYDVVVSFTVNEVCRGSDLRDVTFRNQVFSAAETLG